MSLVQALATNVPSLEALIVEISSASWSWPLQRWEALLHLSHNLDFRLARLPALRAVVMLVESKDLASRHDLVRSLQNSFPALSQRGLLKVNSTW
jgi:hypothetical protein